MGIIDKLTARHSVANLQQRVEAAEQAAADAAQRVTAARAAAAAAMADDDTARAAKARAEAAAAQAEHEAQQDLVAELRRRVVAAMETEARDNFQRLNTLAQETRDEAMRLIPAALDAMTDALDAAQRAMRASVAASAAAAAAREKLPGDEAFSTASVPAFAPMLTDGYGFVDLGNLRPWKLQQPV